MSSHALMELLHSLFMRSNWHRCFLHKKDSYADFKYLMSKFSFALLMSFFFIRGSMALRLREYIDSSIGSPVEQGSQLVSLIFSPHWLFVFESFLSFVLSTDIFVTFSFLFHGFEKYKILTKT